MDVALKAGDNLSMWKGCWRGTVLVALSGQVIIIVDPSVSGFEGMIQRFEVTATGTNVCGTWNIDRKKMFPYCLVILSMQGCYTWWCAFEVLEWCIYSAELSICMLTGYVLFICDTNCLCFIICDSFVPVVIWHWADRLLYETGKLKTSIWSCCPPFYMGISMRNRNCPSVINTCVLRCL